MKRLLRLVTNEVAIYDENGVLISISRRWKDELDCAFDEATFGEAVDDKAGQGKSKHYRKRAKTLVSGSQGRRSSAAKIQSQMRRKLARKKSDKHNEAVIRVQANSRGVLARKTAANRRTSPPVHGDGSDSKGVDGVRRRLAPEEYSEMHERFLLQDDLEMHERFLSPMQYAMSVAQAPASSPAPGYGAHGAGRPRPSMERPEVEPTSQLRTKPSPLPFQRHIKASTSLPHIQPRQGPWLASGVTDKHRGLLNLRRPPFLASLAPSEVRQWHKDHSVWRQAGDGAAPPGFRTRSTSELGRSPSLPGRSLVAGVRATRGRRGRVDPLLL